MTGNDVTYTYGTSGTERGRPIRITDGSGMYECQYDSLGNVTEETRTIALPNHNEVYRFRTSYQYDSWGRMLSMTYPDGEEVAYTYLWGGDLYSMHGTKGANHRVYVSKILYNTFGQRSQVEYGNQTKAYYTYDALHRLVKLKSRNGSGTLMQNISYTFDSASNVTGITNTAGIVNSLGGGYANSYRYDALHRLDWSSGGGAMGSYSMDMGYTPSGRIGEKNKLTHLGTFSETVETIYGYCDTYQPHAVRRIYDRAKGIHHDLRWDGAGNLGQISVANEDALFESGRFLFWTEDSRMHAAVDENYYSYYTYDHGGERRLKLTGENHLVDVNANYMSTYSALSRPTLYPSAYMVVNSKGYTKHYYAGAERVAARIGGGGLDALISLADGGDSLRTKASHLFTQSIGQVNNRVLENNEPDCITGSVAEQDELKVWIEGIPEQLQASTLIDYGEFTDVIQSLRADHNGGQEREVYFYHSDHLGSASWITDSGGQAIQHLQYLPYGEPYINQRTSGYNERFTFTGKERDEETGYGYFGARYMDHELMTMWLSVDPMSDKYPSISPYNYCVWNPIRLVDPDGRDTIRIELTTGEIDIGLSKNEHRVELMKNNEIVWDLNCTNTINVFSYSADTETGHYFTDRIEFGEKEEGQAVFDKISSYASSWDTRCPVEWDYYGMENGSGHLLTSHRNDCVMSYQDAYTAASVCSYDHYHPLQKWSTIPSESDFNHRDRLNSSDKYVPCRLHTGGKYYLFNTLNRKCPSNKSFENKIEFINPEMKSVML